MKFYIICIESSLFAHIIQNPFPNKDSAEKAKYFSHSESSK